VTESYFSELNYTLANEDNRLEYEMVRRLRPVNVLAVCGSGGRSLPLAAFTSNSLICCDLAEPQLALARHRLATFIAWNEQDFLLYWGFPPYHVDENRSRRKALFQSLNLTKEDRSFFEQIYQRNGHKGLIYEGRWERTYTAIPAVFNKLLRKQYDEIFQFESIDEQRTYFETHIKNGYRKFIPKLILFLAGNPQFFNTFLYKGNFIKKNQPVSHYGFYREALSKLFYQDLARKNFFLQLSFTGQIRFPEGNPVEALSENYQDIRTGLQRCQISFLRKDVIEASESAESKFDFVSLSDVPSYFQGELACNYLQRLSRSLQIGAIVVVRYYLRTLQEADTSGFSDVTAEYHDLIQAEKTQMYQIFVFRYDGQPTTKAT
jgi:S-adenosylmethionine-diacylglycerol 3-amino-3-carboxypropyl transferase